MFISKKIRLKPTDNQEEMFWKSANVARWSYNYFLAEQEKCYAEYLANNKQGQSFVKENEIRKYINNVLKPNTHIWLKEVSSNVMKQGVKDADEAYRKYFKGLTSKPKFRKKFKSKPSFYVNYETLKREVHGFRGERIGYVKTSEPLPKLRKGKKYLNPRISYDGKYWYISITFEIVKKEIVLTNESIGIDLGIKNLAICSNGKIYKNINKSYEVRHIKKKLNRKQRKLSRKIKNNIKNYKMVKGHRSPVYEKPLKECKNIQKQKKEIALLYKRLTDIRNNYIHQVTTEIVKTKPSRIVMETLNIKGMMKNNHLSKAVAEQKFFEFKRQIQYKSALYGIEFIEADKWFPSSKTCSCCGNINHNLKLSDRTYKCIKCGLIIDRDYNASINLANYKSA